MQKNNDGFKIFNLMPMKGGGINLNLKESEIFLKPVFVVFVAISFLIIKW